MDNDKNKITLNTVRICGNSIYCNAINISNVVYADKAPDSVIIANGEIYQDTFIATPLIHFPNNAPILFSHAYGIDKDTLAQILKLNPKGINGVQVYIVGEVPCNVDQLLKRYGLKTYRITGYNYFETSAMIAQYLNYPENIMIVSSEDYRDGLSACAWAAHMGDIILLSKKNQLSLYTSGVINATKNAHVYIIGNTDSISDEVEGEIRALNTVFVDRISGKTPYEVAVNFAKYKSPVGDFGWNITKRNGHAFTFASILNPFDSVTGALFAHLGKHAPILTVSKNSLPIVTKSYLHSVKPEHELKSETPFMHGWIVGCENILSKSTQIEIEKALSIDEPHMCM